jgi:lysophospholipase L1-like esterase
MRMPGPNRPVGIGLVLSGLLVLLVLSPLPAGAIPVPSTANGNPTPPAAQNLPAQNSPALGATTITFSEYPIGTIITNQYEDDGIIFAGDTAGDAQFITSDGANPTSPVLSGTPLFTGDVGAHFVIPNTTTPTTVNSISLDVGYIDNPGSTVVRAYGLNGSLLGSVSANEIGIDLLTVSFSGIASFIVTSVTFEAAGFAIDNLSFSIGNYVALGDSYSSGEGDPPYLSGTNISGVDTCHRSALSYPFDTEIALGFFSQSFSFHACSGATIQDFSDANQADHEPAQLSWLNSQTGLVTLTIGGNNADFKDVMESCVIAEVTGVSCQSLWNSKVNAAINLMGTNRSNNPESLVQLYQKIKAKAPNAKILVVGYPRLFPANPPGSCATGVPGLYFSQSDMSWVNSEIQKLDGVIKAAAVSGGVSYVDTYSVFSGHELCTSNPDINSVVLPTEGSFHPNINGHDALAQLVEAAA